MQVDLWQVAAVITGNSGAVMALALYLHKRRGDRIAKSEERSAGQVEALSDRISLAEQRASNDHKALAAQIADTNQTIREHYVRRADLTHDLDGIKTDIGQINGGIAEIHRRIDELFRSVEWRKGTR